MGPTDASTKRSPGRLRLFLRFLGLICLLFTSTALVAFLDIGRWLVYEDPLQPAAAIVVLSGNVPVRAIEAAQLYHQGFAREVWLTHPGEHADALRELGFTYPAEDDFNIRVLRRQGVPAKAIRVLDSSIINTADELEAVSTALQGQGGGKVIVVTDKSHTRRVHVLWTRYYGLRGTVLVHAVSHDNFAADRWWEDTGSMHQVVHEMLGIFDAWTGMPVQSRPRSQSAGNTFTAEDQEKTSPDSTD